MEKYYYRVSQSEFNPREECDQVTRMLCFTRRYSIGDGDRDKELRSIKPENFSNIDHVIRYVLKKFDVVCWKPVYLYDHSGLVLSTEDFNDRWDSGKIGLIWVERKRLLNMMLKKRMTPKLRQMAEDVLAAEFELYAAYVSNDLYTADIVDEYGDHVECVVQAIGEDVAEKAVTTDASIIKRYGILQPYKES